MAKVGWIDSHAHLAYQEYDQDLPQIIANAKKRNVARIMIVTLTDEETEKAIALNNEYGMFDVAFGFHPSDLDKIPDDGFETLEKFLKDGKLKAIGEIGLDYYWHKDNKDEQKAVFIRQIELANRYEVPIIIHMRDSAQDTLDILKMHRPIKGGIMHCYSGSVEMAFEYIKCGMYISLGGPVTFKNAHVPKEVAKAVGIEWLLTETDCPYLTPHPFRGKRNEPAMVELVGLEIARLREIEPENLMEKVAENYVRLFSNT
ncbi:MAG: hydrolase TatD [Firmicutes bacterium HGW-Firmicutes-20]|jgi:TatD DNase family protein|nr:MAG: hydrolase TatD [Firmicutes bacterium HGW-Firmicutes-20]PKM88116.1 MAG: hydrolase TatD [Firmicutes bacterium HGW-Firmicutes-10]